MFRFPFEEPRQSALDGRTNLRPGQPPAAEEIVRFERAKRVRHRQRLAARGFVHGTELGRELALHLAREEAPSLFEPLADYPVEGRRTRNRAVASA